MGIDKFRKKQVIKGSLTVAGSVSVAGRLDVAGAVRLAGATTVSTPFVMPSSHGTAPFFGVVQVGCSVATAVVSTTVIRSLSSSPWIGLTSYIKGALPAMQASGSVLGAMQVTSIDYGGSFTVGWAGGKSVSAIITDVFWEIRLQS